MTIKEYSKVSNTEMKVVREKVETSEVTYSLNYLYKQKEAIEAQKAREIVQRDEELAIVNDLIAKCKELGIKEIKEDKEEIIEPIKK